MKRTAVVFALATVLFFVATALCLGAVTTPVFADESGLKIVLDAGHGGIDGGVSGNSGVKESDINLAICMRLKPMLEEIGMEVVLTRKTSAGLYGPATKGFKRRDMEKRKEIILDAKPDLVLSIHQNFYPSNRTRGGQVFYKETDEKGKLLAVALQQSLNGFYEKEGAKARQIMTGDYFLLNCSSFPSVIVECGFLSNEKDERILKDERGQKRLAEKIVSGVIEYLSCSSVA